MIENIIFLIVIISKSVIKLIKMRVKKCVHCRGRKRPLFYTTSKLSQLNSNSPRFMVLSVLADATMFLSLGWNDAWFKDALCPPNLVNSSPDSNYHIFSILWLHINLIHIHVYKNIKNTHRLIQLLLISRHSSNRSEVNSFNSYASRQALF